MIGKLWKAYEVGSGQEKKESEMTPQYVCLIQLIQQIFIEEYKHSSE